MKHRKNCNYIALTILAALFVLRLGYEYWRLLFNPEVPIDLGIFHSWVHTWFSDNDIYQNPIPVVFPPASYLLLWPLFGWLTVDPNRWFFALVTTSSLYWLIKIACKETPGQFKLKHLWITFVILAIYPTGITIGNGQLILVILPPLLYGLIILFQQEKSWKRDLIASSLLLFTVVKPPVSAPFFLVILLVNRAYRVMFIVSLTYAFMSFYALSFQDTGLDYFSVIGQNATQLANHGGYGNIHIMLYSLGMPEWKGLASIVLTLILAIWLVANRTQHMWILLGVTAMVARLWTYHRLYDDLLLIIPMIALMHISSTGEISRRIRLLSRVLLFGSCLGLLAPGTLMRIATPLGTLCRAGQVTLWLSILLLLVRVPRSLPYQGQSLVRP